MNEQISSKKRAKIKIVKLNSKPFIYKNNETQKEYKIYDGYAQLENVIYHFRRVLPSTFNLDIKENDEIEVEYEIKTKKNYGKTSEILYINRIIREKVNLQKSDVKLEDKNYEISERLSKLEYKFYKLQSFLDRMLGNLSGTIDDLKNPLEEVFLDEDYK